MGGGGVEGRWLIVIYYLYIKYGSDRSCLAVTVSGRGFFC